MPRGPELLAKRNVLLGEGGDRRLVQRVASERWGRRGVTSRRSFSRWFLALVRRGQIELADGRGGRDQLGPRSLFLLRPGGSYELRVRQAVDLHLLICEGGRADRLLTYYLGDEQLSWQLPDLSLRQNFDAVLAAAEEGGPHVDLICDRLLEVLLLRAHTLLLRMGAGAVPEQAGLATFTRAKDLADRAAVRLPSVQAWAAASGVDRAYLSRLCKTHTGQTAHSYLSDRKLQLAADLLLSGHDPVEEIAEQVGYQDASTFNRAFSRRFGVTPGRYRRQE